jgi:hypothetical protein
MGCSVLNDRSQRLIAFGALWLLLVFGCWFFSMGRPGIGTNWRLEPSPPEQLALLKLGDNGEILAQSPRGNTYQLIPGYAWETIAKPADLLELGVICQVSDPENFLIPVPPGKVISQVDEYCYATESGSHYQVVLLENGQVWSWVKEIGGYRNMLLLCVLDIAFVLGMPFLLLGVISLVLRKVKQRLS